MRIAISKMYFRLIPKKKIITINLTRILVLFQ